MDPDTSGHSGHILSNSLSEHSILNALSREHIIFVHRIGWCHVTYPCLTWFFIHYMFFTTIDLQLHDPVSAFSSSCKLVITSFSAVYLSVAIPQRVWCPSNRQAALLLFPLQREHCLQPVHSGCGLGLLKKKGTTSITHTHYPHHPERTMEHLQTSPLSFPMSIGARFPQYCPVMRRWAIVRWLSCPQIGPRRLCAPFTHLNTLLGKLSLAE